MLEFYLDKINEDERRNRILAVEEGSSRTRVLMDARLDEEVDFIYFSRGKNRRWRLRSCHVQ